ncbi:MAG: hypothetical protein RIQ81_2170 [Pseudomonadota bacterium]|jgi:hypothetical protein
MDWSRTIRLLTAIALGASLFHCGGSKFSGGNGKKKPDSLGANQSGLPLPGGGGSGNLPPDLSEGSRQTLLNRFNDFLFAGNGPGSCGLNPTCKAQGALGCPADYESIGAVGDCFQLPPGSPIPMQCFSNRSLCKKSGRTDPEVVLEVKMVAGSSCPAGFSGNADQSHLLGVVHAAPSCNSSFSTYAFCKRTIPLANASKGTRIVSAIAIQGTSQRSPTAPACPAGFEDAGIAPDCSNYDGNRAYPCCHGFIRFCQKLDTLN